MIRFTMIKTYKSILVVLLLFSLSITVIAVNYETTYNPFTSNFDYVASMNQSGNNFTADYFFGDGSGITGIIAVTNCSDIWLNETGDTWGGNYDAASYQLTDLGVLIMSGLITSYSVIPLTTELYTLGNSSNWYDKAYIKNIYSDYINTTNLKATTVNSTTVNSDDVNSERVNINNITLKDDVMRIKI